jgi:H/ACA ribonucleoprotein complex subunit 4
MPRSAPKFAEKGIIILDKPEDLTSMQCVEKVKGILGAKKAGHSGTLDPKVTGVMLIALNDATKAMTILIGLDKEYEGVMHLHGDVDEKSIEKVIRHFRGRITQVPPVRSAVARRPRERDIHEFDILETNGRDLYFRVMCESGTYVRKLCHDFGEKLGVGAHMTKLRRTRIDSFSLEDCMKIADIEEKRDSTVIPLEKILDRIRLKKVIIKKGSVEKIRNGMPVFRDDIVKIDELTENDAVGIYHSKQIIALGSVKDLENRVIKTDRVFK